MHSLLFASSLIQDDFFIWVIRGLVVTAVSAWLYNKHRDKTVIPQDSKAPDGVNDLINTLFGKGDSLDIRYDDYRSSVRELSNQALYSFEFDGYMCRSMDSLLQSFKFQDVEEQMKVLGYTGDKAARYARKTGMEDRWKNDGLLYWKGHPYERNGAPYQALLYGAYRAKLYYKDGYLYDLLRRQCRSSEAKITCSELPKDPKEAVLTEKEFCEILTNLKNDK